MNVFHFNNPHNVPIPVYDKLKFHLCHAFRIIMVHVKQSVEGLCIWYNM
jgi:hypothetical protein